MIAVIKQYIGMRWGGISDSPFFDHETKTTDRVFFCSVRHVRVKPTHEKFVTISMETIHVTNVS